MLPLSLSSTAFIWFTSLTPNSIFTWAQLEKNSMSTFILVTLSLDYHILLPLSKNIMSISLSTLEDLETLGTSALT
jgi:hypothetical protein